LDIAITPPHGTYAQIMSLRGLSLKHNIDVRAGTIDRDYTGNIKVILDNSGTVPYTIKIGDRIAQMVLVNIKTPSVHDIIQL
jgi:dUTP pyrophosphatase